MSSPPITPSIQLVQTTPAPTPTLQLKRVVIPQVRFIYIDGKSYIVTVDSYIDNEPAWEKVLSATDKVMQVATLSAQAYNSDKTALNPERFKDLTEDPDVDNIKITFSCQDPNAELNFEALAYDRKSPKKGASVSKELKTETESLKTILGAPLESSTSSSTLKTSCNKLCPKDSATAAEALTPEEFSNTLSVLAKNRLTSYDTKNDLRTLENDISTATSPSLFVYNLQSNPILVFVHPKNKECFIIDPSGQHRHELITPLKLLKKKDPKTTFFFFSPQKASRQVKDSIKQQQLLLLFLHEVLHIQDNSFTAAQAKKTSYKLFKALSDPSSFVKHFSAWQTSLLKKYENFETRSQKLGVNLYPHALKKTIKD
ncbi:MAG: hypothetical protein FJZ63_03125, partial [Chlamydiae bacterium]|nr:hypothetical protein [Chlamydiota bacterium]